MVCVTEQYTTVARASVRGHGVPDAPIGVLPRIEFTEYVEPEMVRPLAREDVEGIFEHLK